MGNNQKPKESQPVVAVDPDPDMASPPVEAPNTDPPEVRHRDTELDPTDTTDELKLVPDFEAEESDEADEEFEDEIEEGANPEEVVDPNPNEETS